MASKKGNILIVDDNAGIRQALKILLPMHFTEVEVVLFTAYADIALAVEGMKRGAFDFIVKPWDNEKLVATLIAARDKARKAMGRDAKKEGSGIGLSLARQIMRQHNGTIDLVRSDVNQTVFQLIFK